EGRTMKGEAIKPRKLSVSSCPDRRGPRRYCGARLSEPRHVECGRRAGFGNTMGGRQSSCGSQTSCVREKICFVRAAAFSLPLLLKKGGEGRGEEALFINFPSLRLSPHSFLVERERQNAASVLRAEHNWSQTRAPLIAALHR